MGDDRKDSKVNANEKDQEHQRTEERPDRNDLRPNEPERPGGARSDKARQDAENKTTRRGER
mgnify:CR=1 FL=1